MTLVSQFCWDPSYLKLKFGQKGQKTAFFGLLWLKPRPSFKKRKLLSDFRTKWTVLFKKHSVKCYLLFMKNLMKHICFSQCSHICIFCDILNIHSSNPSILCWCWKFSWKRFWLLPCTMHKTKKMSFLGRLS